MKKKNNFILPIAIFLIIATLVGLGIGFRKELKILFSGKKFYTQSQVDEAYSAGRKEDQNNDDYFKKLCEDLTRENLNKDTQLQDFNSKIESQIPINNNLKNQNNLCEETLSKLLLKKNNLQAQADTYADQIPSYLGDNECLITYTVEGEVKHFEVVQKGSTIDDTFTFEFDEGCYDLFNYWQVAGQEVNPVGMVANGNINFVANITKRYLVWTTVNGERTSHVVTTTGDIPTPTGRFTGWLLNNEEVDLEELTLTNNLELIAQFQQPTTTSIKILLYETYGGNYTIYSTTTTQWFTGDAMSMEDFGIDPATTKTFNSKTYTRGLVYFANENTLTETHAGGTILADKKTFGSQYASDVIVVEYYLE